MRGIGEGVGWGSAAIEMTLVRQYVLVSVCPSVQNLVGTPRRRLI